MGIKWTPEQRAMACAEILAQIESGLSLREACRNGDDWTPSEATFRLWCDNDADLSAQYARAREARAEVIFEQILTIADSQEGDVIVVEGKEIVNHDAIQRAKLRVDARKWMLGKMQPKKYGEKVEIDHSSTDGSMTPRALDATKLSTEALREIMGAVGDQAAEPDAS